MLITIPKEARQTRNVEPYTVRAMLTLPDKPATSVGFEVPTGTDINYFKLLLDTYLRERKYGPGRDGFGCPKILQYLAKTRKPLRQPNTDPILWDLRVRWSLRKATLALHHLELNQKPDERLLPPWPTEASIVYDELAARICGLPSLYHGDVRVCLQICDQLRQGRIKADTYADTETLHWLLWAGKICGQPREETFDIIRASGLYDRVGQKVPDGSVDTRNLRKTIQETWWQDQIVDPLQEEITAIETRGFDNQRPDYDPKTEIISGTSL